MAQRLGSCFTCCEVCCATPWQPTSSPGQLPPWRPQTSIQRPQHAMATLRGATPPTVTKTDKVSCPETARASRVEHAPRPSHAAKVCQCVSSSVRGTLWAAPRHHRRTEPWWWFKIIRLCRGQLPRLENLVAVGSTDNEFVVIAEQERDGCECLAPCCSRSLICSLSKAQVINVGKAC